jgi:hypothetical protein
MRAVHKAFSRSSIYTPSELRRIARRLDRRIAGLDAALTSMREGASLFLKYRSDGCPRWILSNGCAVAAEIAAILINDARIVPVGRALFDGMPGQSWRYVND